jgi:hypothetical protein
MSARETMAPTLAVELRETIRDWFAARGTPMESEAILSALADLVAEQVWEHPTPDTQTKALRDFHRKFLRFHAEAFRRSLGGVVVTIVKQ